MVTGSKLSQLDTTLNHSKDNCKDKDADFKE